MTIYIQSRGKSQDHDYAWLKIEDNHQESEIPHALKASKPEELIDSQKPSIILARSGGHLVLLATALDTQDGRTDFMGRQIRNSIAWVEEDSSTSRQLLRKLAIQALKGKLKDDIQQAVDNVADSRYGFKADFAKLQEIEHIISGENIGNEKTDFDLLKVGEDCQQLRKELVKELETCQLPESSEDEIFVVVTTMKSSEGLKAKEVWRGLSSRIKSESEPKKWEESVSVKKQQAQQQAGTAKKIPIVGVFVLIMIGVIIMAILIGMQAPQKARSPERTSMNLNTVSPDKTELPSTISSQSPPE